MSDLFTDLFWKVCFITIAFYIHHAWVCFTPIKFNGNIEETPGRQTKSCDSLSISHVNLSNTPAHNFINLSFFFCAYILVNKFDIICLSETYLNSSISSRNGNLEVPGYTLLRANNQVALKETVFLLTTLTHYHWKY